MQLYHFRTSDGIGVDFVLEFAGQKLAGIEVKSSDHISLKDARGLQELQRLATKDFICGVILYRGKATLKLAPNIWACPIAALWE